MNKSLKSPQRIANPVIVQQIERVMARLRHAIVEYEETALPNTVVDANLNQAIHTLKSVRMDLHLA